MASSDALDVFLQREMFRDTVKTNSGKMAWHSVEVTSVGWGESDIAEAIVFDSLFIERPTVTHGYSIDQDVLVDGRYPRAVGFVRDWKLDPKGFWRGAWVSVCVDMGSEFPVGDGYNLIHSFVFSGVAIKPIREDLTADSDPVPNAQLDVTDFDV